MSLEADRQGGATLARFGQTAGPSLIKFGTREGGREGGEGGREEGEVGEGGREEGRKGRGGRKGRDDCYTYSNIIQWHHSI